MQCQDRVDITDFYRGGRKPLVKPVTSRNGSTKLVVQANEFVSVTNTPSVLCPEPQTVRTGEQKINGPEIICEQKPWCFVAEMQTFSNSPKCWREDSVSRFLKIYVNEQKYL